MVEFLFLGIGFAFLAPLVAMVFHSCYRSYKDYGFSSFPRLAQYAACGFYEARGTSADNSPCSFLRCSL